MAGMTALNRGATMAQAAGVTFGGSQTLSGAARTLAYLPGARNSAEGMQPFELLPEQAVNLTLLWYWTDEPYAALQVGRYRWRIQFSRQF